MDEIFTAVWLKKYRKCFQKYFFLTSITSSNDASRANALSETFSYQRPTISFILFSYNREIMHVLSIRSYLVFVSKWNRFRNIFLLFCFCLKITLLQPCQISTIELNLEKMNLRKFSNTCLSSCTLTLTGT